MGPHMLDAFRTIRVPASSANLGPGFDTLGLALELYLQCRFRRAAELTIRVSGRDSAQIPTGEDNLIWQTARQVAARFMVWLIVAVLVVIGGVVLIFFGTKGTIGAGITAVLAAFGLTWKGIGEFFGRAAAKGEEQLWDAEIDWAIAYRFTVLRNPPADNQLKPRSKEPAIDRPTKEHLRRYKQWKKNWPDVLTS